MQLRDAGEVEVHMLTRVHDGLRESRHPVLSFPPEEEALIPLIDSVGGYRTTADISFHYLHYICGIGMLYRMRYELA